MAFVSSPRPGLPPTKPGEPTTMLGPEAPGTPHAPLKADPEFLVLTRMVLKSGEDSHCFCLLSPGAFCARNDGERWVDSLGNELARRAGAWYRAMFSYTLIHVFIVAVVVVVAFG